MSKIKNIYCLGTSFTEGGGFEFDFNDKLKQFYKSYGETPLNQFNYSWPGRLQKIIGNDIEVHNLAKSGFGNEMIYRIMYDMLLNPYINMDSSLFLIELSGIGRKEYFINEIDDYIVANYDFLNEVGERVFPEKGKYSKVTTLDISNNYFPKTTEDRDIQRKVSKHHNLIKDWNNLTINAHESIKSVARGKLFLISFLEMYNINYKIVSSDFFPIDNKYILNVKDKFIEYISSSSDDDFIERCSFWYYITKNKLTITDETDGFIINGHFGLKGNTKIAEIIYDNIKSKYI